MKLQDSPSLDEYTEGIPEDQIETRDSTGSKKQLWVVISVLGLLVLTLVGLNLWQSETLDLLTGKGVVTGYAIDENEIPIPVEVIIFGEDIHIDSDEGGYFEVHNVPEGEQSVIVAFGDIAVEVSINVQAGVNNSVGVVSVPTDLDIE